MNPVRPRQILLVTGMSGAGKSTALRTLEDLDWEVVDNLPLRLLEHLIAAPPGEGGGDRDRPLAIGIDSRTRDFDAEYIMRRLADLRDEYGPDSGLLFLDCSSSELTRRYSETRRVHPLALDRPIADGIARERELLAPLQRIASHVIDTTETRSNALQQEMRARFASPGGAPMLTVMSFGFAHGLPRNADLVFDVRYLRNPHWVSTLKPMSGLDAPVAAYIAEDPAYAESLERIEGLLRLLLPRYASEGKAYVTVAFGCTGGQHRSVHICESIVDRLRGAGFAAAVVHRDLGKASYDDILERRPGVKRVDGGFEV